MSLLLVKVFMDMVLNGTHTKSHHQKAYGSKARHTWIQIWQVQKGLAEF